MATIKIPTAFIEIELEKLSKENVENLFTVSDSVNKLQQFIALQNYSNDEIIKILSVSIDCK